MTQPLSIINSGGQSLDVIVDSAGVIRLKLAIGSKAVGGLANVAGWQGVATHVDQGEFVAATDGLVAIGGVDRTGTDTVRPIIIDQSGQVLVDVAQRRLKISQTPTVSSGAVYAAKDAIGGLLTFASAARAAALSGVLEAVTIVDKGQQMAALDLVLFSATLTAPTDNAAFDPTDAELATCVGVVHFAAADYYDFNDNAVASVRLTHPYVLAGTSLFGALVSRGTPTYTSTTDIVVSLGVRTD